MHLNACIWMHRRVYREYIYVGIDIARIDMNMYTLNAYIWMHVRVYTENVHVDIGRYMYASTCIHINTHT